MEYLIRFVQLHETFRKPETDALADLAGLKIQWISYSDEVRHPSETKDEMRVEAPSYKPVVAYYCCGGRIVQYPSMR